MYLTPNGLKISNMRKRKKAAQIYIQFPCSGTANKAIQTPTISSTTTLDGSSPHSFSSILMEGTLTNVKNKIAIEVIICNTIYSQKKYGINHNRVATKAPIVPGANLE